VKCKAPERSGCSRDAKGCCVPAGSGTGHTTSGNRTGSARQDPDDLMRPDAP
jgi:hypothetical protein